MSDRPGSLRLVLHEDEKPPTAHIFCRDRAGVDRLLELFKEMTANPSATVELTALEDVPTEGINRFVLSTDGSKTDVDRAIWLSHSGGETTIDWVRVRAAGNGVR